MAIVLENEYLNTLPGDPDYPQGSFKNASNPLALDGTPFEKAWADDIQGILQKLLDAASITPSGSADTVLNSQYFQALINLFSQYIYYEDVSNVASTILLQNTTGSELKELQDNQLFMFRAIEDHNGPAVTLQVDNLPAKVVTREDGLNLPSDGILESGENHVLRYDLASDEFKILAIETKVYGSGPGVALLEYDNTATTHRITIPDPGTDANMVLTEGAQDIAGTKTFTSQVRVPDTNPPFNADSVTRRSQVSGWARTDSNGNISQEYNVNDVVDLGGAGIYDIIWERDFSFGGAYSFVGTPESNLALSHMMQVTNFNVGLCSVRITDFDDNPTDLDFCLAGFGTLS